MKKLKIMATIMFLALLSCEQKANQVVQIVTNPTEQPSINKLLPVNQTPSSSKVSNTDTPTNSPIIAESLQSTPSPKPTATVVAIPPLDEETVKEKFRSDYELYINKPNGCTTCDSVLEDITSVKISKDTPTSTKRCSEVAYLYAMASNPRDIRDTTRGALWTYSSRGWLITKSWYSNLGGNECGSYKWPQ